MLYHDFFNQNSPLITRSITYDTGLDPCVQEVGYNRVASGLRQIFKRDVYILHYIVSGKGTYMDMPFDKECGYIVYPSELELICADEEDPYESYWIMFKGRHAYELLMGCNLIQHNGVFTFGHNEKCVEIIKSVLYGEYSNPSEEAFAMQAALYSIIAVHMSDIAFSDSKPISTAHTIGKYIENNYYEKIVLSDLAKTLHITRNHQHDIFKKVYGCSPQEYLIKQRIEKSKQLLQNAELSIKEISAAVGIDNQLYFSRLFRKCIGINPSEYRRSVCE